MADWPSLSYLLPAAGSGTRMGSTLPKPFLPLGPQSEPVLFRTLQALLRYPQISEVVLILPPDKKDDLWGTYGDALRKAGVTAVASGGDSRQASVANGLAALRNPCDLIAVHDAVRPFPSRELLCACATAAQRHGGSLPVLPVTDTVKRVDETAAEVEERIAGAVHETVPRAGLYAVQTPQVFRRDLLVGAYERAASLGEEITDDAMVVEAAGGRVVGVQGERYNLKLTTPDDLSLAEALLAAGLVGDAK